MIPVTEEFLKELIEEQRKKGNDVSKWEKQLKKGIKPFSSKLRGKKKIGKNKYIFSTGRINAKDFE